MSLIDSTNEAPVEPPAADDVFPDEGGKKTAIGGELPDAGEVFPDQPERKRVTGTVAPGPLGDWLFGNTQQSSLARIMHAFGAGVHEGVGDHAKKLMMSDETAETLRKYGIFNDYVSGQSSVLKAYNETFLRSGAVVVNTAIHGVPAVVHGLQEAAVEAGEQAEGTALGHAIGARQLSRDIAAAPEAFPTGLKQVVGAPVPAGALSQSPLSSAEVLGLKSRPMLPERPAISIRSVSREEAAANRARFAAPVPEPLAAARDLNVIGPGGEAAWKGVAREEAEAPASVVPQEALPAEAPKDVHEVARAADPETFKEFDALEKRRDLFRKWMDDPDTTIPPNVPKELKETEARLRELEPKVAAAYDKAKEGLPAETEVPEAPTEAAVPQGAPEAARPIEDQRDYIVQDAKRQLKAAGRPEDEAAAVAQLIAARYEARASRMNGALGTAEELYDREAAEIRGQQIRAKVQSAPGRAALEGFQERMAQGKEGAFKRRDEGQSAPKFGDRTEQMREEAKASTPQAVWDDFAAQRQARNESRPIETGYNAETTKGGSQVRHKASQVWEPGNTVDVGIVKNLLIAEKNSDGSFTLLGKPDKEGMSQTYNSAPQKGLAKEGKVKFLDKTRAIREPTPEEMFMEDQKAAQAAYEDSIEALEPEERAEARQEFTRDDAKELHQATLGKINLNPKGLPGKDYTGAEGVRPVLTLMKNANASTAVHELGHEWLAQMLRDAEHERAPEGLKADRDTVLKWFGIEKTEDIATKHHEKFARGFEQYLREGVAPSQRLARVFAKFKEYLTRIYQTLKGLGQPINDDIRRVFDRMLEQNPERVTVAAEREAKPDFHERHTEAAETTAPEYKREVAEEIQAERDSHADQNLVEQEDAASRLENTEPRVGVRTSGASQPAGHADEARQAGAPGASAEARSVVPSGGEAEAGRAGVLPEARGEIENPNTRFSDPSTDLIDKAGNIRLDKLNQAEDVTEVIRQAARNNNDFLQERRGVLSDGTTLDLADALGMDPAWLDRKKIGEAYNVEEIRAARRLLVQSAQNVRELMIAAKGGEQEALQKLAEGIARHEMIQGKVSGATAEAGRALRAFREMLPGQTDQLNLDYFLKTHTGRTLFQLQEMARLGSRLESPAQVSRFVHDTANGKLKQAVLYYYVNSLISGPITHARYFAGNALTALWAPVKTTVAAGIDTAATIAGLQNERRIFLGEAGAELYAFGKGSREGWKAFKEGWSLGNTPHLPGEAHPDIFGTAPVMPPIPGAAGRVLGYPGKAVAAIHGMSSAVRYEQEIAKLSYRQAAREGLSGQEFVNRVADLGNRPPPEMTEAAARVARSDLYMAPATYGSMESKISAIANHNIVAKIILPFTKIGTQIASQAIENSPAGIFMQKVRDNVSGKNGIEARNTQLASITASTALMGTMVGMASEGLVTGAGPSDPAQNRVWRLANTPYSINIGGVWIPYRGLGMLGMQMSMAANAYEANKGFHEPGTEPHEGDLLRQAGAWIEGFEKAVLDDTWARGLNDMLKAVFQHEEYGDRYITNMVTNWVPFSSMQLQLNRAAWIPGWGDAVADPYQRETRGNSLLDEIEKQIQSKVPLWSQSLMPRRDMFGEPIPNGGAVQNYANDPVVKLMTELNFKAGPVPRKIRGVDLTDQQHDEFSRLSGRLAKVALDEALRTPGFSNMEPAAQVERMHKIITIARGEAEKTVMMEATNTENDIWAKATENKKIKKGLVPEPVH